MKRFYPAIIDTNAARSVFGVTFPDFPGCTSAGDTADEAALNAAEALAGHVTLMMEDSDDIPTPTPFDKVKSDDDLIVVGMVMVPVTLPGPARRININLAADLIDEIDAVAKNRSAFLADAARAELARRKSSEA